jgi:hypothetical protein
VLHAGMPRSDVRRRWVREQLRMPRAGDLRRWRNTGDVRLLRGRWLHAQWDGVRPERI